MFKLLELLGENIRFYRTRAGYSQTQLTSLTGISNQTISNIENGRTWVGLDVLLKLSKALNVSEIEFFQQERPEPIGIDHPIEECVRRVSQAALSKTQVSEPTDPGQIMRDSFERVGKAMQYLKSEEGRKMIESLVGTADPKKQKA